MLEYDIKYPVFYRNDRDMRTIIELAALNSGVKTEKEWRELNSNPNLVLHDAFDDTKNQIEVLCKAWKLLAKSNFAE